MLQRVVGRVMGAELRIEVAQDSNANGVGHMGILNNARGTQATIEAHGLEGRCQSVASLQSSVFSNGDKSLSSGRSHGAEGFADD